MGMYREQFLPRLTEWLLDRPAIERLRAKTTAALSGDILEIGFGTGLNLPVLPAGVNSVHAVDPDQLGRRLASARIDASEIDVHFTGLDGQRIPLEDESMDHALSTFTLCSIARPEKALAEIGRVLKVGGSFCFLEHGHAPVANVAKWQRRINPIYSPFAGGCRLDLRVAHVIREAGFEVVELENSTLGPKLNVANYVYRGVAIKRES